MVCGCRFSVLALTLQFLRAAEVESAAARSASAGKGRASARRLAEEFKAFESAAASLDAAGWRAFLDTASRSARSERDRRRQSGLDERVSMDRSIDISVSDHFASNIQEEDEMPTLRQLAKQHWEGLVHPQQPKSQQLQNQQAGSKPSLRNVLRNAGRSN
uniref:Uncharacterized protein n=1 Tax=Pyrodinium bahamense TaxID=73915 RepID=A0A7S0AGV1_9DINO|mmetsp:Transcript_33848/g.93634  ORF Transcript_33848/g.93634 Transcript_33848/m.93634 type:complete len:160 (+) Transcript_33848:85-564(+)